MMITVVGTVITLLEFKINVMTVAWLPVLSVCLIIHPSNFYTHVSCVGAQKGWSYSKHALG